MIRRIAAFALLAIAGACASPSDTSTTTTPTNPNPSAVTPSALAVSPVTLEAGDSVLPSIQVTVDGVTRAALASELVAISSDTSILVIGTNGALIAVGDGTVTVTVKWAADPSISTSTVLAVTSERLIGVSLTATPALAVGDSGTWSVSGVIRGSRIVPNPGSVTVTSENPSVVAISGTRMIGAGAGSTWIVARATSGVADSMQVLVTALPATQLVLTTHAASLDIGQSTSLVAVFRNHVGGVVSGLTPTFVSNAPLVATVSTNGTVTAVQAGSTLVIASLGVLADTFHVTVNAPVLQSLVVTPSSISLAAGASSALSVQAFDTHGNLMALPVLTWTSQLAGVTVTATGLVAASSTVATSTGTVKVTSGSVTTLVTVSTTAAPVTPPSGSVGYVQIRWIGTQPDAAVLAAFEAARTKINALFRSYNGVTPITANTPADYCLTGIPAVNETVNGIIIYAQVTAIDGVGNILGSAGPCLVRGSSLLPFMATMKFDVADMDQMVSSGTINGVVLHEMMHTLGFGTIWGPGQQDQVPSESGTDPEYLGTGGETEYAALGASAANGVPVENTGSAGTRGAHWRESVFHTELMTGWADGAMAMSRVTVAALRDFGYDVDLSKADPYTLPSSLIAGASLRAGLQIVEDTRAPIGVVDASGKITPYQGTVVH